MLRRYPILPAPRDYFLIDIIVSPKTGLAANSVRERHGLSRMFLGLQRPQVTWKTNNTNTLVILETKKVLRRNSNLISALRSKMVALLCAQLTVDM